MRCLRFSAPRTAQPVGLCAHSGIIRATAAPRCDGEARMTKLPLKPLGALGFGSQSPGSQDVAGERIDAADADMLHVRDYDEKRIMKAW